MLLIQLSCPNHFVLSTLNAQIFSLISKELGGHFERFSDQQDTSLQHVFPLCPFHERCYGEKLGGQPENDITHTCIPNGLLLLGLQPVRLLPNWSNTIWSTLLDCLSIKLVIK